MPNELNFDIRFTRGQIEKLLVNTDVKYVVVSGTYTYHGGNDWIMTAVGEGCDVNNNKISGSSTDGCPQPCPVG